MKTFLSFQPDNLDLFVKKISIITEHSSHQDLSTVQYFADGFPGLMFHRSETDVLLNLNERRLSEFFLYGQTVKPIKISTIGPFQAIIIFLYPHVTKSLFGIDAHELRDTCISCDDLKFYELTALKDKLTETKDPQSQLEVILTTLRRLLYKRDTTLSKELHFATQQIIHTNGAASLRSLHQELRITERTFERKFLQHVGVTPSLFKRICKFQSALSQLHQNSFDVLTDIAYDQGFADQSHFIRTFREFTGYTPKEYLHHFAQGDSNN